MAKPQGLLSPLERQTYESFGIAPREDRLSLLPRYSAKTGLVAPQFVYDAAKALAAPYTAAQGYDLPPEEAVNVGMNMMGGGAVGTAPKGALRTFIGRDAKTWDKAAEKKFLKLEKSGVAPEDAWKQTGVFRSLDNDLRQEISDKQSYLLGSGSYGDVVTSRKKAFENAGVKQDGDLLTVNTIYQHPALFRAYPSLTKVETEFLPKNQAATGQMAGNILGMQYDLPNKTAKSVMLHELQHGIQSYEGFSPGANTKDIKLSDIPSVYIKRADKLMTQAEKLTDQDKLQEANKLMSERNRVLEQGRYAAYMRNAGEVEARLTQRRMNLTDAERRANFPLNRGLLGIDVNPSKVNF